MSEERVVYSIQRTYILKPVSKSGKAIVTCNQRIDIPKIEPLTQMRAGIDPEQPLTVVPCIELAGIFLSKFNFTFETNEGVTVLPIKIVREEVSPSGNPYSNFRYVLVLPRDATGVKSCKLIHEDLGEVQHNFTFGIMPPPYNYDNASLGVFSHWLVENMFSIRDLYEKVTNLDARVRALENKAGG